MSAPTSRPGGGISSAWLAAYRPMAAAAAAAVRCSAAWARFRGDRAAEEAAAQRLAEPGALERLPRGAVWLHAASVGEAGLLPPLLAALRGAGWNGPFLITTQTLTGRDRAASTGVPAVLAPLDAPGPLGRFIETLRPALHVIVETEIWPLRLLALERAGVPCALVSARLSARRFPRYRRLGGLMRTALRRLALISPASEEDRARLLALGAPVHRMAATGNLKWDAAAQPVPAAEAARLARELDLASGRRWIVLGSVHPGEAGPLARAVLGGPAGDSVGFLVAPRHPERFAAVARELREAGVPTRLASESRGGAEPAVLLDRMGALRAAYPLAQTAVLGGTFVPVGGHSPLEAAAAGCPLVSGPYVDKQADLVGPLERAGALVRTASPEEAAEALARWVLQPEAREAAGTAARVTLARHRGVAERIAPEVLACLG